MNLKKWTQISHVSWYLVCCTAFGQVQTISDSIYIIYIVLFPSHHNKQNDGGDHPRSKLVSQECLTKEHEQHEQHECVPPVVAACPDRWSQADSMVLLHRPRSRHQHWSWGRGPPPLPCLQAQTHAAVQIHRRIFKSSWHIEHGAQRQKKYQKISKRCKKYELQWLRA